MQWYSLLFVTVIIEALITYGKTIVREKKLQWQVLLSMALGVVCAFGFGIDLFAVAGIEAKIPYLGIVLTGILLSRGSNYIFDLISTITKLKNPTPSEGNSVTTTIISNNDDSGKVSV